MVDVVRVDGLIELEARLKDLAALASDKDARQTVSKALRKMGQVIQKDAQNRVHVKTGTLRENIIVTKKRSPDAGTVEMDVTVRYKAKGYKDNARNRRNGKVGGTYKNYGPLFYGRFLEFGTSKMPAYPFLRPAFETNKASLPDIFKTELSAAIDAAVAKAS